MTATITVYVAGSSRDLERVERVIAALRAIPGVVVPVDWPAQMRAHGPDEGLPDEDRYLFAGDDAIGVGNCDAFVLLRPSADAPSAGAWVEFGMALGFSYDRAAHGETVPFVFVSGRGTPCIFDALIPPKHIVQYDDEAVALVRRIAEARAA